MWFPPTRRRRRTALASGAYAVVLLLLVVESSTAPRIAAGALLVFALSAAAPILLVEEHGLRSAPIAFFGAVGLLLAAACWRAGGHVDAFVAMSIHLLGLFVLAAVSTGELFLGQLLGTRGA